MREIRQSGSEGGAAGVTTGRPYPYQDSDLVKRHRGRVTVDDEASGASPRRG